MLKNAKIVFIFLFVQYCLCPAILMSQEMISGPREFFKEANLLVSKEAIPFVADTFCLKGSANDTTKVLLAISLSNSSFEFVKHKDDYVAEYEVFVKLTADTLTVNAIWEEVAKVASMPETTLTDETTIFQTQLGVIPAEYKIYLEVRDQNSGKLGNAHGTRTVPRFGDDNFEISQPILLYNVGGEKGVSDRIGRLDDVSSNPRRFYRYSKGIIPYYIEFYTIDSSSLGAITLVVESMRKENPGPVYRKRIYGDFAQFSVIDGFPVDFVELGTNEVLFSIRDDSDRVLVSAPTKFLITLSSQWVANNFDEMIRYLKYIATPRELKELKEAPEDRRLEKWDEFWARKDPVPRTLLNEKLVEYFGRIDHANQHFSIHGKPGWLSDMGMVYITLGPPDEVIDRYKLEMFQEQWWIYDRSIGFRLVLVFNDRGTMGNFKLENEDEFQFSLDRLKKRE